MSIGIYKRCGGHSNSGYKPQHIVIPLEKDELMADLRGRLFVKWGGELGRRERQSCGSMQFVVRHSELPHHLFLL
jgi:hypothetical protein